MLQWLSYGELRDAVGINCKKGATTENQGSGVKYMGLGVYHDDCVTWPLVCFVVAALQESLY